MNGNRHAVDQLADVRAEIKQLKAREEKLRSEVVASGEMVGDDNEAALSEFTVERIDLELMKQELGLIFLRPFLREQIVKRLQIKPRGSGQRKPRRPGVGSTKRRSHDDQL